jgi:hypothetical protein
MKKLFLNLMMVAAFWVPVVLTSCDKDDNKDGDNNGTNGEPGVVTPWEGHELVGKITSPKELDANVVYDLIGPVIVEEGGSLTIPAGTRIQAVDGFSCYILVARGGKIFVNGTAEKPVTMTSGNEKPAAEDWGGLIINGAAPLAGGTEGSTEINTNYMYGGTNADDNSGVVKFLKIEYTGARNGANIEHNGLTLNGVGRGTEIHDIFIPNGADDGIEFFGGTVDVSDLLVVNSDDDMFDMTQGWVGTLKNCYGIWETGFTSGESDPSGVEADGNFDGNSPAQTGQSDFTIENMTIVNNGVDMNNILKIRRGATATIINALVEGTGTVKETGFVVDMTDSKGNGSTASKISITNKMTNPVAATKFGTDLFPNVTVGGNNTGCSSSIFGWTGYIF